MPSHCTGQTLRAFPSVPATRKKTNLEPRVPAVPSVPRVLNKTDASAAERSSAALVLHCIRLSLLGRACWCLQRRREHGRRPRVVLSFDVVRHTDGRSRSSAARYRSRRRVGKRRLSWRNDSLGRAIARELERFHMFLLIRCSACSDRVRDASGCGAKC